MEEKQRTRRDADRAFGESDYAITPPVKTSCKQWESIITTPERAWYEVLKLYPLWDVVSESPMALWVGTWVHEALSKDASGEGVYKFFSVATETKQSLQWRQARALAWQIASGFSRALQDNASETVGVEKSVSGEVEIAGVKIPLTGRIDRILKTAGGEKLIIDFKTGSTAAALSEKKLEGGDGLQLWLYGRLIKDSDAVALCRLAPEKEIKEQVVMRSEPLKAEKQMAEAFRSGILGQKGELWGRFGGEERLPLAALPIDWRVIKKRRANTHT